MVLDTRLFLPAYDLSLSVPLAGRARRVPSVLREGRAQHPILPPDAAAPRARGTAQPGHPPFPKTLGRGPSTAQHTRGGAQQPPCAGSGAFQ